MIRDQGIEVPSSAQKKLIDFGEDSQSQEQINPFDEEDNREDKVRKLLRPVRCGSLRGAQ